MSAKKPLGGETYCTINAAAAMCERVLLESDRRRAVEMQAMARAFDAKLADALAQRSLWARIRAWWGQRTARLQPRLLTEDAPR